MPARLGPRKAPKTTLQRLAGMLSQRDREAFLEALRSVSKEVLQEDAAYLALRMIGRNARQAHRMIVVARSERTSNRM